MTEPTETAELNRPSHKQEQPDHVLYENGVLRYEAGNHQITITQAIRYMDAFSATYQDHTKQQGVYIPRIVLADLVGRSTSDTICIYFGIREKNNKKEINLIFGETPHLRNHDQQPHKHTNKHEYSLQNQPNILYEFTNGFPPERFLRQ